MADDMKLVQHENGELVLCHLKNDRQITSYKRDGKNKFYIKRLIYFYTERPQELSDESLHQFIKKRKIVYRRGESLLQMRGPKAQQKVAWIGEKSSLLTLVAKIILSFAGEN